jgi:hypothetical protein
MKYPTKFDIASRKIASDREAVERRLRRRLALPYSIRFSFPSQHENLGKYSRSLGYACQRWDHDYEYDRD